MYCEKKLRLLRIRLQLLAQTHQVCVDRTRGRVVVISPDVFQQAIAAQRLAGMTDEIFQQLEFFRRNVDGLTRLLDSTTFQVHFDLAEAMAVLIFWDYRRPSN